MNASLEFKYPFDIDHTTFIQCSNGALIISNDVEHAFISLCNFTDCSSKSNGGAISSSAKVNFSVYATSFSNCQAADKGSCLYVITGKYSLIVDCEFGHSGGNNPSSIFLNDQNVDSTTLFITVCFTSIGETANVKYIYSEADGIIYFDFPCFDSSRENNVYTFHMDKNLIKAMNAWAVKIVNIPRPTKMPYLSPKPSPDPTNIPDDDSSSHSQKKRLLRIILCLSIFITVIAIGIQFSFVFLKQLRRKWTKKKKN